MMGSAKYLACFLAFSLLGTCHNNHRDVSGPVRSGHSIQVKESTGRLVRTVSDSGTIEEVGAFMAQHADSWSGEEIFGTFPASRLLLDVRNEKEELLIGVGVGDESLWIYPSKGVWRHLDRRERDRLLRMLGIAPASVPGLKQVGDRPQNNEMQELTSHG